MGEIKGKLTGIFLFTCFSVCLIGCTSDDTVSYKDNSLNGTWNLIRYGGGFSGQFEIYYKGVITWSFDSINNSVRIRSKRDYFGPKSGSYPYEIRQVDANKVLFLNDSVQGILYLNEDELIFQDALIATFKR